MKTFLTAAILGVTGLAGVAGAEAQDVHQYRGGNQPRHERRGEHRGFYRNHNRHRETVRVERVWIAPRVECRIVGYDHCGKPIYGNVCVSAGYWTTRACD